MAAEGSGAKSPKPSKPLPTGVSAQGQWLFEGYTLDESTWTLSTPTGASHKLDRSAFLVLQYLLLHAGQLCTHDELLLAGWPGRRVSINSATKCVSRLRQWLDDDAGERIRLTHGYGYLLAMRSSYRAGSALQQLAPAMPQPDDPVPGRPEWRLFRHIGSGSSSEVYAARHGGSLPPRAYKFARDERGLRALKRELALQRYLRTEHPDIDCLLPVLDARLEQMPFFLASPLQEQGNLADWASAGGRLSGLPRATRLRIAQALCASVARLHAAGLAHRDLKPQNLYVETQVDGYRILLADLGAGAGVLPPGVDGSGVPIGNLTRLGSTEEELGSDIYLAPELLSGAAATIQSDLYALGLLVFQLMVGDLRRTLAPGWESMLADPLLAADIAEAANLDPAARPASAAVLADRLHSLESRRQSLEEAQRRARIERELGQIREAAGRRRRLLSVLGLLMLVAVVGLLVTLQLYRGAEAARAQALTALQQAEREARTSRAVLDFMNGILLDQADPWGGGAPDPAMKALLERAAREIDERFAGEPASAVAVHEAVADAWEGWGVYPEAMRHSRRALDLLGALPAPAATDRARLLRKLCRQARMAQQLPEAEVACGAGAAIEAQALGRVGPALEVEMAKLAYEQGHCDQTLTLTGRLLARAGSPADPPDWLREALWFRGICHGQTAEFALAREEFERLLALPWNPEVPAEVLDRAWAEMDYAEVLVMEGDFIAARPWIEAAATRFEARLGPTHPDTVLADYQRARIDFWSGDPAAAVVRYQRVLEHWSKSLGPTHLWTLYAQTEALWARSRLPMDTAARESARREWRELRDRTLPQIATRASQLGFFAEVWARTALALDELEAAGRELERGRQAMRGQPPAHPRQALFDCIEADLEARSGRLETAGALLDRCVTGMATWPSGNYRWQWVDEVRRRVAA